MANKLGRMFMAKVVLYRKYRSQNFDEIIGQDNIVQTVRQAILTGRLGHAYLLAGPRGVGKTSLARILSRAVNCPNLDKKGNPCNQCENCRSFLEQNSLDLIEVDAASHRGIDDIRFLQEGSSFVPVMARKKVFIIDEVHMLTKEAFNALLKTLEEPPEHLLFILATTELDKVPETVVSRCQIFVFQRISLEILTEHLEKVAVKEGRKIDREAAGLIARMSAGGGRDALGMLEQVLLFSEDEIDLPTVEKVLGLIGEKILETIIRKLFSADISEVLEYYFQEIYTKGVDVYRLMDNLQKFIREIILEKYSRKAENQRDWLRDVSLSDLVLMMETLEEVRHKKYDLDSLYFEMFVYKTKIAFGRNNPVTEYRARINQVGIARPMTEKKTESEEKTEIMSEQNAPLTGQNQNENKLAENSKISVNSEQWRMLVEKLCQTKPVVGSMLKMARLINQENGRVSVEVPYALQKDRLMARENYSAWQEVCREVVGGNLELVCMVNQQMQSNQEKKIESEKNIEQKIKRDLGLELMDNVLEVFGGRVVK